MLLMVVVCCVLFLEKCVENLERKGDISIVIIRKVRIFFMIICKMLLCCKRKLVRYEKVWKILNFSLVFGKIVIKFCLFWVIF